MDLKVDRGDERKHFTTWNVTQVPFIMLVEMQANGKEAVVLKKSVQGSLLGRAALIQLLTPPIPPK